LEINKKNISKIKQAHSKFKEEIESRSNSFKKIGKNATPEELFTELAFCILTPQSKAKLCWETILTMRKKGILRVILPKTKKEKTKEVNIKVN